MLAKFKRSTSFNDVSTADRSRIDDTWEVLTLPKEKWVSVRFVGPISGYGVHWIEILTKRGKTTRIPKYCLAYDPDSNTRDSTKDCPYCELESADYSREFYVNAIIRDLQEDEPSRKAKHTEDEAQSGFKDKNSKSWTPVRVVRLPVSLITKLNRLSDLNRVKSKDGNSKSYDLSHEKYGCDVFIQYNPEASGTDKYNANLGQRSPLTEEEMNYLLWDIEDKAPLESVEEARREAKSLASKAVEHDEDDEDSAAKGKKHKSNASFYDDDEDDLPKSKAAKKKPAPVDDDDDDDDGYYDDNDEDDAPQKKSPAKKKPAPVDDDEDDEDDVQPVKSKSKSKPAIDIDDDADLYDEPPAKSKSKNSSKPKVEDDDLDDIDDEEEEQAPRKKKPSPVDDDDEDEASTPPRRRKTPPKKGTSSASRSRPVVNDDEDDDF